MRHLKQKIMLKIWYVYLDSTLEPAPRIFYVGKGNDDRILRTTPRNQYWSNIANKYGWQRTIIMATKNEQYAFEIEIANIQHYKTFEKDWPSGIGWGANLTRGGEGSSGAILSIETKMKISLATKGKNNPMYGKHQSTEAKHKISIKATGRFVSNETRKKQSCMRAGTKHPMYGKHHAKETKVKISHTLTGKFCGEKHKRAKLTQLQADQIRNDYKSQQYTRKALSIKYNVSVPVIDRILANKIYKSCTFDARSLLKGNSKKRGIESHMYGKKLSSETKAKISKARKHANYNGENSPNAKLTQQQVNQIREEYSTGTYSYAELANKYQVSKSIIHRVIKNKTYK